MHGGQMVGEMGMDKRWREMNWVKQIYKKWVMIHSMNLSAADQREPGECDAGGAEMDVEEVMMNDLGDGVKIRFQFDR